MVAVTIDSRRRRAFGGAQHLSLVGPTAFRTGPRAPDATCSRPGGPHAGLRSVSATTYRRRRVVALVVAAAVALAAWAALGALGGVLTAPVRSVPLPADRATIVEVGPGDTLWGIARRLQPDGDPRPLVDRLAAAHGGPVVHVGERLVVD